MATSKRKSQSISAGITAQQYNESLAKYANNAAEINKLTAELEAELTKLRDEYDGDLSILDGEQKLHMAIIKAYCLQNREGMFGDKKSLETLFGKVGFRKTTPSLKCLKGYKWEDVVELLKEELPDYVRTVDEPNKEKLLADREKEDIAAKLSTVGLQVSQTENFFIEMKEEKQETAKAA